MNLRVMFVVACSILGISTARTISTRSGCCDTIRLSYPNQDLGKVLGKYRKSATVSQTYNHVDYQSIELRDDGEGNWIFGDTLVESETKNAENADCPEDVSLWRYRSGSSWTTSVFVEVSCEEGQVLPGDASDTVTVDTSSGRVKGSISDDKDYEDGSGSGDGSGDGDGSGSGDRSGDVSGSGDGSLSTVDDAENFIDLRSAGNL